MRTHASEMQTSNISGSLCSNTMIVAPEDPPLKGHASWKNYCLHTKELSRFLQNWQLVHMCTHVSQSGRLYSKDKIPQFPWFQLLAVRVLRWLYDRMLRNVTLNVTLTGGKIHSNIVCSCSCWDCEWKWRGKRTQQDCARINAILLGSSLKPNIYNVHHPQGNHSQQSGSFLFSRN